MNALNPIPLDNVPRLALRRAEAAEAMGVSDRWLWERTKTGDVPHVTIGSVTLYPVDELRRWLANRAAEKYGEGNATT